MFNPFNLNRHPRLRRLRQFCLVSLCLIVALLCLGRNWIARHAIERIGSYVLGNTVHLQQIEIGWRTIELEQLSILEKALDETTQVHIERISVATNLWGGWRSGQWFDSIVLREPTLHLRFDADGAFLNHFPTTSTGQNGNSLPLKLPFRALLVRQASLIIHQTDRTPLAVRGASLSIQAEQQIRIRGEITDLLGSKLHFQSQLSPDDLSGSSLAILRPLQLNSKDIAKFPLLPAFDIPATRVTLEGQLRAQHPAGEFNLLKHSMALNGRISDFHSASCGLLSREIQFNGSLLEGLATVQLAGALTHGNIACDATASLTTETPQATGTFRLSDVELQPLAQMLGFEIPVEAIATTNGNAQLVYHNKLLNFQADLAQTLANIRVDGVPVDDVATHLNCTGSYAPNRAQALVGVLTLETASDGVALQSVAERYALGAATGRLGWQASGTIPLETLTDLQTYAAQGSVQASEISSQGLIVAPLTATASLRDGEVSIDCRAVELSVAQAVHRPANCIVNHVRLSDNAKLTSSLRATLPIADLQNRRHWRAAVDLEIQHLSIAGEPLSDFSTRAALDAGELQLSPCTIRWRNTICKITGQGHLSEPTNASAAGQSGSSAGVRFTVGPISLHDIGELAAGASSRPLPIAGAVHTTGAVRVDLQRLNFQAGGDMQISDAAYAGAKIGDAKLTWDATAQGANLHSQSSSFLGGTYAVDASMQSLDWTKAQVRASLQDAALSRLIALGASTTPLPLGGTVSGALELHSLGDWDSLDATGWGATQNASVAGIPLDLHTTVLRVENGRVSLGAAGSAFEGQLAIDADAKLADVWDWSQREPLALQRLPVFGLLRATSLKLDRALPIADPSGALRPLRGAIHFSAERTAATASKGLLASLDFSAENIRWNRASLSQRVKGSASLHPQRLVLHNLDGQCFGGSLSGAAEVDLTSPLSGSFRMGAEHVNLRRAAAPVRSLARSISGTGSVAVQGRLGNTTTASLKLHANNLTMHEVVVQEVRMPIECSLQLASQQVRWQCRGGTIHLGRGTISVTSDGSFANGMASTNTHAELRQIDTAQLLRGKAINAGTVSGDVYIQAQRANTANDLQGRFAIELTQLQSLEIPGIDQFQSLLKLSTLSGPSFLQQDGGSVHGRIAGGLVYVDDLFVSKSGLQVLLSGTSSLDGRVNFDVTALTQQSGPADGLISLAQSPLMLAAPAPVALLMKANEALKNRVVHVQVSGTAARPTLSLQPGKKLSQDALRMFISGTLGSQAADLATRQQYKSTR
ncbi:AsmA-like C-terminal region-containing protein [Aureliella helgolandensis]|uniref:Putative assembly protein n=1 Tax=Aureliella helgolandensis TaxID=2527968 RepID=A0A518GEN2_9BACT|nr:AsmA-like C-terminal region-containing protein [Aureliella helgolandensis]QDV27061.1 putative assembly protein [Aureliella helgolandensis]